MDADGFARFPVGFPISLGTLGTAFRLIKIPHEFRKTGTAVLSKHWNLAERIRGLSWNRKT